MRLTRRSFLGCAAGTVAMGLPFDLRRIRSASPVDTPCVLLDLQRQGGLSESLAGYAAALTAMATPFECAQSPSAPVVDRLIVPGATDIPVPVARAIATRLESGARVILESAVGFAPESVFHAQRAVLCDHLRLRILEPVHLWRGRGASRVPYVDYTWPHLAKLRDFSRVVPLGRQEGEIIAWADGLPVALRRRCGRGTLVFLGSPLGPALFGGDREARRWLQDVLQRQAL